MNDKLLEYIKDIGFRNEYDWKECVNVDTHYSGYSEGAHKTCLNILNAHEHLKENDNLDDFEEEV